MNRLRKKCESLEKKSRLPSLISEQPFLSAIFWRCLWAREGFDGDGARAVRGAVSKGQATRHAIRPIGACRQFVTDWRCEPF